MFPFNKYMYSYLVKIKKSQKRKRILKKSCLKPKINPAIKSFRICALFYHLKIQFPINYEIESQTKILIIYKISTLCSLKTKCSVRYNSHAPVHITRSYA